MKMSRAQTALLVLRQAAIIAAIIFILTELALRAYNAIDPLPVFYDSSYNRFRGKPFSPDYDFHLNSHGFKDVEFSTQKAEGTFRILGIGNSFAFGVVPYNYNYLTLLKKSLNQDGKKIEVINMGNSEPPRRRFFVAVRPRGPGAEPEYGPAIAFPRQ